METVVVAAAAAAAPRRIPVSITKQLLVHDAEHSKIKVKITIPDSTEECPLTLNPIQNDELPFLQGVTFSKSYTNHKKMTLPCNHSFGAMALIYHFARNKVECPLCRAGKSHRLDTRSIPLHFRRQILDRIRQLDIESTREQDNQNEVLARELFQGFVRDLDRFLSQIHMSVYMCVDNQEIFIFRIKMIFVMRAVFTITDREQDAFHFGLTNTQRSTLMAHINDLGITQIALGFSIQDGDEEPREISRTIPFSVEWNGPRNTRNIQCTVGYLSATSLVPVEGRSGSLCWSIMAEDLFNA